MAASVELMSSSLAMVGRVGAMMVEIMMRLKPVADKTSVTIYLRPVGQSMGFAGIITLIESNEIRVCVL